jgi:hypothetical protein
MLECVGKQRANNRSSTSAQVPDSGTWRLFVLLVPHSCDEHQGRCDCGFEAAEKYSGGDETGVGMASSSNRDDNTPKYHHDTEVFGSRISLHAIAMRELQC